MSVEFTGDWDKARDIIENFEKRYRKAVKAALTRAGLYLKKQIQKGIRDQKPGGKEYEKLHPITIERKGSKKAMIDDGDFFNAITFKLTSDTLFVGVLKQAKDKDGKPLVNIAEVHEYGREIKVTPKMRKYLHGIGLHLKAETTYVKIPARPTFGPVWDAEVDNVIKIIEEEFQKHIFGK